MWFKNFLVHHPSFGLEGRNGVLTRVKMVSVVIIVALRPSCNYIFCDYGACLCYRIMWMGPTLLLLKLKQFELNGKRWLVQKRPQTYKTRNTPNKRLAACWYDWSRTLQLGKNALKIESHDKND